MSGKIKIWLQAFRLQTLPLALSNSFLGSFLALSHEGFKWSVFVFAILTTLFLQILSNLANDYGDAKKGTDNADRIGPTRVTQTGLVSPSAIRRMILVFVVLSLISGVALIYFGLQQLPFLISLIFFFIGLLAIFAAIKYTIGKNPYGYAGFGDVFVFIFFGLVGVCGTYFLHVGNINLWILLPASAIGFLSVGVLNMNNLRDVVNDSECGKMTIAVRLGVKAAKIYHLVLIGLAFLLGIIYTIVFYKSPFQLIFLITLVPLLIHIKTVMENTVPIELNNELKKLALTTFAFSLTFGLGLIL